MSRCLLCGKSVENGAELCDECKKYSDPNSAGTDEQSGVFSSDSEEIRRERTELYTGIKPSDGKGWYILAAVSGVLAAIFWIVSICVAFSENASDVVCDITVSAAGSSLLLCFLFFFFGQMIKRKNTQIYLQNEIIKELSALRNNKK